MVMPKFLSDLLDNSKWLGLNIYLAPKKMFVQFSIALTIS